MEYIDSVVTDKPKLEPEESRYYNRDFSPWDIKKRTGLRTKSFSIPNIIDLSRFWEFFCILLVLIFVGTISANVFFFKRIMNLEEKLFYLESIDKKLEQIQKRDLKFEQFKKRIDRLEESMNIRMDDMLQDLNSFQKKLLESQIVKPVSSNPDKIEDKSTNNGYHTVQRGETLYNIGRKHGLTVKELQIKNKLSESAVIRPGQKIFVSQ